MSTVAVIAIVVGFVVSDNLFFVLGQAFYHATREPRQIEQPHSWTPVHSADEIPKTNSVFWVTCEFFRGGTAVYLCHFDVDNDIVDETGFVLPKETVRAWMRSNIVRPEPYRQTAVTETKSNQSNTI